MIFKYRKGVIQVASKKGKPLRQGNLNPHKPSRNDNKVVGGLRTGKQFGLRDKSGS